MYNLNILIVEDESLVAMELKESITQLGYNVVDYATNCAMARELMSANDVNLILMDINLRDTLNGVELYKEFNTETPVIYLTAYKDDETISSAIQTNPLGYLIKPHNEDELKAVLKLAYFKMQDVSKSHKVENDVISLDKNYFFNKRKDKLFFNDIFIKLSNNELILLKLLIDERGNIVSYETIESEVWSEKVVSNSALRTLIYRLRGKLNYKFIESEYDYGIKLT